MRILLVDDDETISEFVTWVLTDEGHEVARARNGAIALELVDAVRPDLILLDMRMPIMDGWQFARAYRERRDSAAPIVVLTAARDAAERAREIGAEGYLGKPFDLGELLSAIELFKSSP